MLLATLLWSLVLKRNIKTSIQVFLTGVKQCYGSGSVIWKVGNNATQFYSLFTIIISQWNILKAYYSYSLNKKNDKKD